MVIFFCHIVNFCNKLIFHISFLTFLILFFFLRQLLLYCTITLQLSIRSSGFIVFLYIHYYSIMLSNETINSNKYKLNKVLLNIINLNFRLCSLKKQLEFVNESDFSHIA